MNFRLDRLQMSNFRCFSECAVTFHPTLTVLIADNGRGKTAIMDAAATAMALVVDEFTQCNQSAGIAQSDVRLARSDDNTFSPRTPTQLDVEAVIGGTEVIWSTERKQLLKASRRSKKALARMIAAVNDLRTRSSHTDATAEETTLPVVCYYSSARFSHNGYFGKRPKRKPCRLENRLGGYQDFLDPLSDSKHFNEWYEQMDAAVRTHVSTGSTQDASPLSLLTAVRATVDAVLRPTAWGNISWNKAQRWVAAEHPVQGQLPLGSLSSGVRNMVALTADLAHRCARLNPALRGDAASLTPGIVLIDEVDLHLHPSWQQQVVGLLRVAFPAIQFILSTHSPQVLSTVNAESIRVIKLCDGVGEVETPKFQTRGVESADVLTRIMKVDPIPKVPEANWLSDYRAVIEEGREDSQEAVELREKLIAHFGEAHPVMLDCDRLIRFTRVKKRRTEGGNTSHA